MNVAGSQQRIFLQLVAQLRPYWRRDAALPMRIKSLLAGHREFGSRDRRLYRELIYTTLRYLPWIEPLLDSDPGEATRGVAWFAADSIATRPFREKFATGSAPAGDKTDLLPGWFRRHCPELFYGEELETQLRRAPLWLRLQTNQEGRQRIEDEFSARGWLAKSSDLLPDAVEVSAEADVTKTDAWRDGRFEVQDLGSQMILASVGIQPGEHWLDACAGAGGKTLQLARLLGASGKVDAHDVRPTALAELERRAARARHPESDRSDVPALAAIQVRVPPQDAVYDGVLVDAPCSGSGTWRRAPHLKWITQPEDVLRAAQTQRALLDQMSGHVRSGGRLVYATCSLSRHENEEVVAAFLAANLDFQPEQFHATFGFTPRGNGLTIMPSRHNTDGFFVGSFRRG
jgi:16S rRNA (cytosine967-C5)-methyltransferase